jgi:hypothetical protein
MESSQRDCDHPNSKYNILLQFLSGANFSSSSPLYHIQIEGTITIFIPCSSVVPSASLIDWGVQALSITEEKTDLQNKYLITINNTKKIKHNNCHNNNYNIITLTIKLQHTKTVRI